MAVNVVRLASADGSPNPTQWECVTRLLEERPDLARRPTEVSRILGVAIGSAKRLTKRYRDSRRPPISALLGPVLLQNVRLTGRTEPGTVPSGSPCLAALGPWKDRGDGKLTASLALPPDGRADVSVSASGTLEVLLAAPRGLTPAEVLQVLALLRLPFDRDADATLSFEALRDGGSLRFEGVEARTYRDAEGVLLKMYNHADARGALGRIEVRTPAVRATWPEIEAWLEGKQPLGRDAKIDALALQVRENSEAILMLRREVKRALKAFGSAPGSPPRTGVDGSRVRGAVRFVSPANEPSDRILDETVPGGRGP